MLPSGGGAVTVVKSYKILNLQQPLIVTYGNISEAFIQLIKDVMPPRLLGTGITALVPDQMANPAERQRALAFINAFEKRASEKPDLMNMTSKMAVDVAASVLQNVADPSNYPAVKKYLESTPIPSVQTVRFSPTNHVGLDASAVMIVELKNGRWVKADPVGLKP
jgi:branched-chain amino acid transport system substrate-binding protein